MLEPSFRPRRRPDVRVEEIDDEVVLFDARSGKAAYLNETAALVWKLCDGQRSLAEMSELLTREMDGKSAVADDVHETVVQFVKSGLVA